MSEALRRTRCNDVQKNYLVDFMLSNRELALGTITNPMVVAQQNRKWAKLAEELAKLGPRKSVEKWKTTWRDLKSKAKIANAERILTLEKDPGNSTNAVPVLTELNIKILAVIGRTTSEGLPGIPESPINGGQPNSLLLQQQRELYIEIKEKNIPQQASRHTMVPVGQPSRVVTINETESHQNLVYPYEDNQKENLADPNNEGCEPRRKKHRQDKFTIVKKCCVNLVKKHGRSVTLFDDLAFRELIDLIPMTQSEKQTLTSQYIQTLLDDDQLDDQTDMEATMNNTTEDIAAGDDDEDTSLPLQVIKDEVEAVLCTCGKDTDESMSRHTVECPASSQQTYWEFFEIFVNRVICQICNETLTTTDVLALKEHLQNSHPSVEFVDEDDDFEKGPSSEDELTNDFGMEEVYLDETILETEQTASAAKRRRKRAKAALNITGPITRENIALSLQRFKSLDSFGQYVASLMKLIPKDKCIKLQIEMVERLLHEQAAAG